ncbi:UNVERIFIED_CONTAM: hypothetical protein GTU68_027011 [Idotea baltica]|nr:hypothetical protein [Idotea baltica]
MRVLLSGASGLVGSRLTELLTYNDHTVVSLSRQKKDAKNSIQWNPEEEITNIDDYENFDAVIHLAGENIADERWSEQKKRRILDSRVKGTNNLVDAVLKTKNKPKVFISASAIGIYGNRPHEKLNEESAPGDCFLADTCIAWEKASKKIEENNIRLVKLRIGIVLAKKGGALKKMLLPFSLGLGGKVGDGTAVLSWISNEDLCRMFVYALENNEINGAYNATAPNPVANYEFTKTLASALNRPAIFPIPEFVLKIIFGEMAKYTILSSLEVYPQKISEAGFKFEHETLRKALKFELRKT